MNYRKEHSQQDAQGKGVKRAAYFKDWNKQCIFGGSQST